ncbi:hypothetical protein KZZ52_11290 [Dactylosporangium sp. AC04546]|uniref:hypothetical protein n=1 Tax=Dactylosporangium sp. AC04546 TaxID=2862460 RepID=UPI001EDE8477|nr:hypothetical protein [Dactylosporangium sp. AC04546]WVK85932.1 hypothetical protein KZZ52_11290 [Dactylosporangium sp. AC04546]
MRFSWEVFEPSRLIPGQHVPLDPPWRDIEDADRAQDIADRLVPHLLPNQQLKVWDTEGVGHRPVLTVDA